MYTVVKCMFRLLLRSIGQHLRACACLFSSLWALSVPSFSLWALLFPSLWALSVPFFVNPVCSLLREPRLFPHLWYLSVPPISLWAVSVPFFVSTVCSLLSLCEPCLFLPFLCEPCQFLSFPFIVSPVCSLFLFMSLVCVWTDACSYPV